MGRYLTPDPIGLSGGIHLFDYVGSNPINTIDRLGLEDSLWALRDSPTLLRIISPALERLIAKRLMESVEELNSQLQMSLGDCGEFGLRGVDYVAFNLNLGPKRYLLGGSVQVVVDRYGNVYAGPGPTVGKSWWTVVSASLTGGFLLQHDMPSPKRLEEFLTESSFNASAGYYAGIAGAWTPNKGYAFEGGFVSPQVGVSYHYSWKIGNIGLSW